MQNVQMQQRLRTWTELVRRWLGVRNRPPADRPPAGDRFHFHEDCFCQIEILPRSAWQACEERLSAIRLFAEAHRDGDYYTNIYMRPDSAGLEELRLRLDDFDRWLLPVLPRHDAVTTGYGSHVVRAPRTVAYGVSASCCLFVGFTEERLARDVWLQLWPDRQSLYDAMLAALTNLAKDVDVLVVDWEQGDLLALRDEAALRRYLSARR